MDHPGAVELRTQRLTLRKILPQDAGDVYAWMSDPEVCRYERWTPHPSIEYSRGYILAVFRDGDPAALHWGIELAGSLIGSVSVVGINDFDQKATLGYCLARRYWSKGYATEAVRAVLEYIFTQTSINRLEASHSVNNPASGKVLEKAGFLYEGLAKEYYRCGLGFQDSRLFALIRRDYTGA